MSQPGTGLSFRWHRLQFWIEHSPVAVRQKPLEVLRTILFFDPCLVRGPQIDPEGKEVINVSQGERA